MLGKDTNRCNEEDIFSASVSERNFHSNLLHKLSSRTVLKPDKMW